MGQRLVCPDHRFLEVIEPHSSLGADALEVGERGRGLRGGQTLRVRKLQAPLSNRLPSPMQLLALSRYENCGVSQVESMTPNRCLPPTVSFRNYTFR